MWLNITLLWDKAMGLVNNTLGAYFTTGEISAPKQELTASLGPSQLSDSTLWPYVDKK